MVRSSCGRTDSVLGGVLAKTEVEPATQSHHGSQVDPELVLHPTHLHLLVEKVLLGLRHHPSCLPLVLVWPDIWWWW